ncbi:MAG TPA: flavodoxin [Erysipelotrichaceae bacterium]|nr:flavodoxin [Erysipelotrichaceae bacterium]
MSKIAVVYWSGTGNTMKMAEAVAEGAQNAGAEVSLLTAAEFGPADVAAYDAIAFGCPSMGAEQLEETEFEPMFASVEGALAGKKTALFGSWGWGGGVWMDDWKARTEGDGADLAGTVICANEPDEDALAQCRDLGASLA